MRIAYVFDGVYPYIKGGGERRVYEVAKRLTERGHKVTILGMKCWDGPNSFSENGLRYRAISRLLPRYNQSGRRKISQAVVFGATAWRMIAHEKYDVIDCAQFPFLHLFAAKAYSLLRRTPFVLTWYEVLKYHWVEYFGNLGYVAMAAEKTLCRISDMIVAISETTQAGLLELGAAQERMTVILDGIDYQGIQAVQPGPFKTDLSYCGRLRAHKNVHLLIEAVASLKRFRPEISAVIIGDGPEAPRLWELASRLGLNGNIIFTGALDDFNEVLAWLKASKIFVHPSTKEGGSSMTLFEANACGLPVIAMRCPTGIDPRLIQEGENGYLVDPDPEMIAKIALELLNSPERLAANAVASRKLAANHDWERVTSQYEEVYACAVSETRMNHI
jgi:L-malate glycosyltransferase